MNKKERLKIEFRTLLFLSISFVLGIIVCIIYLNIRNSEATTLSTSGPINFVFSIALSTASIILAINAIQLGRYSEKAMVDRSDESIKLQNEVFKLTTEALRRIESSTGVTEKRIEDIISGRVGDISHNIAGIIEDTSNKQINKSEIEEEIKKSIMSEIQKIPRINSISDEELKKREERRLKRKEQEEYYIKFQQTVLIYISNLHTLNAKKIGHGHFQGENEDLFDGIFSKNNILIGISVISGKVHAEQTYLSYINALSRAKLKNVVQKMLIIFISASNEEVNRVQELKETFKEDISDSIYIVNRESSTEENFFEELTSLINRV
jgi:hypothetical protein